MKKDLVYRQQYLEKVRPIIGKSLIKVFIGHTSCRKKLSAFSDYAGNSNSR